MWRDVPRTSSCAVRVRSLYKRLYRHYGPQHWWPADSAWEMMVGAILTQNTAWTNVEKAISALKHSRKLSLRAVARMPRRQLEKLIRPTGYFRQKAKRVQRFARALLKDPSLNRSRERLLAQHGIGPETADSILLYAARRSVFVVDAYTRRIGQRIGLFKTDDYDEIQRYFHENCRGGSCTRPQSNEISGRHKACPYDGTAHLYNEFHALIVRLAKEVCTKRAPHCSICPVKSDCAYGRRSS